MQPFRPYDIHQEAAQLLANGELTDSQIAAKLEVDRKTLWHWRQIPEFVALVDGHLARFREEVRRRGLANPDRRLRALNDRWNRLQRIIEARADDSAYADVPGGTTGLLVRTRKKVGNKLNPDGSESADLIDEFAVDVGLLKELREHEKQAAQELGQWVERQHVDQTVTGRIDVNAALARLSTDDLDQLDSLATKLAGGPDDASEGDPPGAGAA